MIEKIIAFLILGIFVFVPTIPDWKDASFPGWFEVYLPWVLLIALCLILHLSQRESRRAGEDRDSP